MIGRRGGEEIVEILAKFSQVGKREGDASIEHGSVRHVPSWRILA